MTEELDAPLRLAFQKSWDYVERFYRDTLLRQKHWQWLSPMALLIRELRDTGYDQLLLAGLSVYYLNLSRCRAYGAYDPAQYGVRIEPRPNGSMIVRAYNGVHGRSDLVLPEMRLTHELVEILRNLKRQPVS